MVFLSTGIPDYHSSCCGNNQRTVNRRGNSRNLNDIKFFYSNSTQKVGTITLPAGSTQAVVSLSEVDAVKVKADQKVTITMDAYPNKTFTGKVAIVDTNGTTSSNVTTYPATIVFDNAPDVVYPNMAVDAKIITNVKDNVILVPSAAVSTTNGASTVRIMKNGNVTSTAVEIGLSNDTQTEIVSGVSEGDTVVTGKYERNDQNHNRNELNIRRSRRKSNLRRWRPVVNMYDKTDHRNPSSVQDL